jgi:hypothetical protein
METHPSAASPRYEEWTVDSKTRRRIDNKTGPTNGALSAATIDKKQTIVNRIVNIDHKLTSST